MKIFWRLQNRPSVHYRFTNDGSRPRVRLWRECTDSQMWFESSSERWMDCQCFNQQLHVEDCSTCPDHRQKTQACWTELVSVARQRLWLSMI